MNVEAAHAQPFRVEIVAYDTALEQLHAVREEVFIGEQHVPAELERDALDPLSTHALATLLDASPFPEFTARVCPALCEGSCVQALHGEPVTRRHDGCFEIAPDIDPGRGRRIVGLAQVDRL